MKDCIMNNTKISSIPAPFFDDVFQNFVILRLCKIHCFFVFYFRFTKILNFEFYTLFWDSIDTNNTLITFGTIFSNKKIT